MSLPLVVLAAGLSTRYGRLKQLDPLGPDGEAIMDYNIFDAARAGFDRIIVVTRSEIENDIRAHLSAMVGEALPIEYVHQTLDKLPEGFHGSPERTRPWVCPPAFHHRVHPPSGPTGPPRPTRR